MRKRSVELPPLVHDFSDAIIDGVSVGPRREVTLRLCPVVWEGNTGRYSVVVPVRFGGIENFAEVAGFFAAGRHERSELAWLRYAEGRRSKPGCLFFELAFERIDARLVVQCSSLQVGVAGEAPDAEPGAAPDRGRM